MNSKLIFRPILLCGLLVICISCLLIVTSASFAATFITPKVINGKPVSDETYAARWQSTVILVKKGASALDGQFCAGTLIAPTLVLTAAHCVTQEGFQEYSPANTQVIAKIRHLTAEAATERINIANVYLHPKFNQTTMKNDLALIRLASATSAPAISYVTAAEGALWGDGAGAVTGYIAGWGNLSAVSTRFPAELNEAEVPLHSDSECAQGFEQGVFIARAMLCAGVLNTAPKGYNNGVDSCQGDSGGPLLVSDGVGGYKLAGITSWGYSCASQKSYGVYTRVGALADWIASIPLDSGGPQNTQAPTELTITNIGDTRVTLHWTTPISGVPQGGYIPVLIANLSYDRLRPFLALAPHPDGAIDGNTAVVRVPPNQSFRVALRPVSSDGSFGDLSNIVKIKTLRDRTRPTNPIRLHVAKVGAHQFGISFKKSHDNDGLSRYIIQFRTHGGKWVSKVIDLEEAQYQPVIVSGLKADTLYQVRVLAADWSNNKSVGSRIVVVKTL